jgi:Na+/melibiose symporter-like transporter
MVLHSLTMIFTAEKDAEQKAHLSFKKTISELVKNKNVLKVTVVFILYYIANYVSTPFYGTYIIGELGLSLKFATAMTMASSISRILVSRPLGRYADKNSFAKMIEKCFIFLAASQVCVIFAVPSTGRIAFVLYYLLHGIAMGGLNSALTNLIFDYVPYDKRADSIAVTQAFSGVVGFLTTLSVSPLVSFIQKSGNRIFGISMYAQQFVTIIALVFSVIAIIYIRRVLINKKA